MREDVFGVAAYLIEERLDGEQISIASAIEFAKYAAVRPECLIVLLFGFLGLVLPVDIQPDDSELIECVNLAKAAAGVFG